MTLALDATGVPGEIYRLTLSFLELLTCRRELKLDSEERQRTISYKLDHSDIAVITGYVARVGLYVDVNAAADEHFD